jgi:hypothetical protein
MREYCRMIDGRVNSIMSTSGPVEDLVDYKIGVTGIVPIERVPLTVLQKYSYWYERP